MNPDCERMRQTMKEYYDQERMIEWLPAERCDELWAAHQQFMQHIDECPACHQAWLALMDQQGQLRRPEDIFCPANSTKAWETGLINLLPREEVEEVRRSAMETPCERAQRYARRYGREDRYVQIHLSWCERCRAAHADTGAARADAPNAGAEAGGQISPRS